MPNDMLFPDRYLRNADSVTAEEQEILKNASVLVAGCGGLGGYVIELLARVGVGNITGVDGDVFQPSNLNRQLFSKESNIGAFKAEEAMVRIAEINSEVNFTAVCGMLTEENADKLLSGKSVAVDALDNAEARLILARAAGKAGIPMVHGAISGWHTRVYTVMPGDNLLETLFSGGGTGTEKISGNLPFTAALCASQQAAETVKLILGKGNTSAGRIIETDLLDMTFEEIDLR